MRAALAMAMVVLVTAACILRREGTEVPITGGDDDLGHLLALCDEYVKSGLAKLHDGPPSHASTNHGIEIMSRQQVHRSTATMVMVMAAVYTQVGELDKAIDELDVTLDMNCPISTEWLKIDPIFASLHNHPGFQALIECHG